MLWLAHAFTLARVPLAIAIWFAYGQTWTVVALIAGAATSDAIDGNLARYLQRRGHTTPNIGGWLDPAADKLFVAIVLATIWWHSGSLLVIALIGAREWIVVPLVAIYVATHPQHPELHADWLGKIATVVQFHALAVAVAYPPWAMPLAIAAAVTGIAAAAHYAIAFRRASTAGR